MVYNQKEISRESASKITVLYNKAHLEGRPVENSFLGYSTARVVSLSSVEGKSLDKNSGNISLKDCREESFFTNEIIRLVIRDDFDDGEEGEIHRLFDDLIKNKPLVFRNSFQRAWMTLLKEEKRDLLYKFICASSVFDYDFFEMDAFCLVTAALSLDDESINDAAIRAIESWGDPDLVSVLKNTRPFSIGWLEDYRKDVVNFFEGRDD